MKNFTNKILMTGGTGYLGRRLLQSLASNGFEVAVLKRKSSKVDKLIEIENVAIFNIEDGLSKIFEEWGVPDIIIHAATCYGKSGENEKSIYEANYLYPKNILDLSIDYHVKYFINCDTSLPFNVNIYAKYKKLFTNYLRDLASIKKIKVINMRLENFYGPNDLEIKLPAFIIRSCLRGAEMISLSPGYQIRDFIHIDDIVSAFNVVIKNIKLVNNDVFYTEFQVGTGVSCSIREFAEIVKKLTNSTTKLIFGDYPYRKNEIMYSVANNQSLRDIGWKPVYTIENGLMQVILEERRYLK